MPYTLEYQPADLFMVHKGISVYYVYKDDDPDLGTREYYFDTREDSRDEEAFDVRDLAEVLNLEFPETEPALSMKRSGREKLLQPP